MRRPRTTRVRCVETTMLIDSDIEPCYSGITATIVANHPNFGRLTVVVFISLPVNVGYACSLRKTADATNLRFHLEVPLSWLEVNLPSLNVDCSFTACLSFVERMQRLILIVWLILSKVFRNILSHKFVLYIKVTFFMAASPRHGLW